jgi:hypothetical protein
VAVSDLPASSAASVPQGSSTVSDAVEGSDSAPAPTALETPFPPPVVAPPQCRPREHDVRLAGPHGRPRPDPTRHQRYGAVGAMFRCLCE